MSARELKDKICFGVNKREESLFEEEKRMSKRKTLAWWTSHSPNDRPKTRSVAVASFFPEQDLEVATAATYLATSHRMRIIIFHQTDRQQQQQHDDRSGCFAMRVCMMCACNIYIFVGTNNL